MSRKLIIALSFAFASILVTQKALAEEKLDNSLIRVAAEDARDDGGDHDRDRHHRHHHRDHHCHEHGGGGSHFHDDHDGDDRHCHHHSRS